MSGEVFQDIRKIFEEIGISTTDEGSLVMSVYKLDGTYYYRRKHVAVHLVHYYWPHYSKILIIGLRLPREKTSVACELANQINAILDCDRFIIIPETGEVQLRAGFYSGMVGSDDENEGEDEGTFSKKMDGYSYQHLCRLIYHMTKHFYCLSPLFNKLIKTDKLPSEIIEEFWKKSPNRYDLGFLEFYHE